MIDWGKVFTSWTLWTNVFLLLIGIVDYMQANPSGFPIKPEYLGLAAVILNIMMRFKTNDSLTK